MPNEKIEITLTDFIDFVNKKGSAKQNHVLKIKNRDEYEPYKDFYKIIREAIQKMHKNNLPKTELDNVIQKLTDKKKKDNYPGIITGYKKFIGRKKIEWIKPPHKDWKIGDIIISVNPEIGLEEKKKDGSSDFYIIKLYFKDEAIRKEQIAQILTLMEMQLRDKVKEPEVKFAFLDIRRSKLHIKNINDLSDLPLLKGEAQCLATMWKEI